MVTFAQFEKFSATIRESEPEFARLSAPRRYVATNDYPNFNNVFLPSTYENAGMVTAHKAHSTAVTGYSIWVKLVHYAIPLYYVDANLCEALAATAPPSDLTLSDIKWPIPAMVLMVPKSFSEKFFMRQVNFITAARFEPGEVFKSPGEIIKGRLENVEVKAKDPQVNMYFDAVERETQLVANYSLHCEVTRKVSSVVYDDIRYHGELIDAIQVFDPTQDNEITNRIFGFVVKLLLVMTARQSYIEAGTCLRAEKTKHGRLRDALWSPNYIGRNYRVLRDNNVPATGTHASPRLHWRRGHIRNQPHGEGRSLTKVIWIEPCLIGATEDEDASKSVSSTTPATKQ